MLFDMKIGQPQLAYMLPLISLVTVSLDRQKDISRNSSVNQLIYLKAIHISLITKERVLNNMSYYLLKSPLTRTHGKS